MKQYVIGIDQSTQGTKALLFDCQGKLLLRRDIPHRQYISEEGYVSHDLEEIYQNVLTVTEELVTAADIDRSQVVCVGISNQRETVGVWDRETGRALDLAIVWQCARAEEQCLRAAGEKEYIQRTTGLPLSPYFCASKIAWYLEHDSEIALKAEAGAVCFGTIDSWLLYRLTAGACFATDYSNASRTQLFDIDKLKWDERICSIFGIPVQCLADVRESDSCFGTSDFGGFFPEPIPIHAMMGDSHGALFGQGCLEPGMIKATYGTGSSIMLNTGEKRVHSQNGLAASLAWGRNGKAEYALEGNINYTGAVIAWMQKEMELITCAAECEEWAYRANKADRCYLIPAFTGLGAPHWESNAKASIRNMGRFTGKAEIIRAGVDCIAYQISDVLEAMRADSGLNIREIRVDGGPTGNGYLMQFQSDIGGLKVQVPDTEELSGIGAAYMAGLAMGVFEQEKLQGKISYRCYVPVMSEAERSDRIGGWKKAVEDTIAECR